ncbi:CCA tRNA nucleotidyltransferase [Gaiella sp.]|uniref:CCA tRNA nucleotidyltransferase n=1 Tax=Gaiella sp. TaxID=2663207 RepID=UPI002E336710|nr:HD domain-containing protein [Gaiella sp.]HEX5584480.1 HD domain-containing protein [Gaiella sp.]
MPTEIRRYIRSLGLDAYVVGGAVRDELLGIPHSDEDFLVPGVDHAALRAALEPHGRVEDMEVHGQLVGVRFHPSDPAIRALVPRGIELTPPRIERSTGPGHHDFEIVADGSASIADDMRRRDFTVNALARRLETGELVDPCGGVADLERRELRTVSNASFREDPLRILRGLRLVSQLGFMLAPATLAQMRAEAQGLRHVSGERVGGGIALDGLGELSKLLLGARPAEALRLARDTGALVAVMPEFQAAIGLRLDSDRQPLPLDEHLFAVVQAAADAGTSLAVRLAALLHDLAKPETEPGDAGHGPAGAVIAARILRRLRYPNVLRDEVVKLVSAHGFDLDVDADAAFARRFLASHGLELARELLLLKRADLAAKNVDVAELERLERLAAEVERQRESPHRLADLAVGGDDLIALGWREGPALGAALARLLDEVVDDPRLNDRERLLGRARELAA